MLSGDVRKLESHQTQFHTATTKMKFGRRGNESKFLTRFYQTRKPDSSTIEVR